TLQRTAKSCGPGAATLASIRPACAGLATVTIKAAHRGEYEVSRKAIARGKPGCPGCTCGLTRVHFCSTPTHTGLRAQSAPGFPCALLFRARADNASPGRKMRRGNAKLRRLAGERVQRWSRPLLQHRPEIGAV